MPLSTIPVSKKSGKHTIPKNLHSTIPTSYPSSSSSSSSSTAYSPLDLHLRLPQLDTVIGDSLIGSEFAAFSPNRIRSITPPPPPSISPTQLPVEHRLKHSRRGRISSDIPTIIDARKALIRPSAPLRPSNYSTATTKRNSTLPLHIPPFRNKKLLMQSSSETLASYGTSSPSGSLQKKPISPPGPVDESSPLLVGVNDSQKKKKKPFYRARPMWLVPFAITASIARGMTLAPRVEIYTQLSCAALHRGDWNHTQTQQLYPASLFPHDLLSRETTSWDLAPSQNSSTIIHRPSTSSSHHLPFYASIDPLGPPLHVSSHSFTPTSLSTTHLEPVDDPNHVEWDHSPRLPSTRCMSDPAVQAGAARLQTIMTTTMGLLSALTTGWWGHFGERHGRTKVLAVSTLGILLTDITFILVSTPSSPLAHHGHKLLLVAPVIEGLLGGWSTLQSATSAYISDCTSSGSRAQVFSRFTGVFYLGFSLGPAVGGWIIANGLPLPWLTGLLKPQKTITGVFWISVFFSLVNFLLVIFVFPESLSKEKRQKASKTNKGKQRAQPRNGEEETAGGVVEESLPILQMPVGSAVTSSDDEESSAAREQPRRQGVIAKFLSPLAVFLPVTVVDSYGLGRKKKDWSLTLLAGALFGVMLSTGVFQIKYLYAVHVYGWNSEQLSYYISAMGGSRAIFLLFLLPSLIGFFKPKPIEPSSAPVKKAMPQVSNRLGQPIIVMPAKAPTSNGKKPKPTRAQLGTEIGFDLVLTRISMMIDILSHTLVSMLPAPEFKMHMQQLGLVSSGAVTGIGSGFQQSQTLFVLASGMNSMGSGAVPAMQSLALCILQVRKMDERIAAGKGEMDDDENDGGTRVGPLFGALAVVQAVGQMILGPMLFGVVYSQTVGKFSKTIFVVAAGILVCALAMMGLVRNPVRPSYPGRSGNKKGSRHNQDIERGRSRVSKDLRGGAIRY